MQLRKGSLDFWNPQGAGTQWVLSQAHCMSKCPGLEPGKDACSQMRPGCPLTGPPAFTPAAPDLLISSCLRLALTMDCALRPWQTNSLRTQERPCQLPFVEPPFCPTMDIIPMSSLLMPFSLGVERPWGPEAEAEDRKVQRCATSNAWSFWAHPRLSAPTTPFTFALRA